MCGIVGMSFRHKSRNHYRAAHELDDSRKMFTNMLIQCQRRGSSATGVMLSHWCYKKQKPTVSVLKAPLPAEEFVKLPEYKKLLDKLDNDAYFIVGHTRAVTNGSSQNNRNNHPHRAGKIIGVHNGVIKNDMQLWKECKSRNIEPTGHCDSEAIFGHIENGRQAGLTMEEATAMTMKAMSGWYALAMMDVRKPTQLVLVRDDTTPIVLAWIQSTRIAVFASERNYIESAVKKLPIPLSCDYNAIPGHTICTIDSVTDVTHGFSVVKKAVNVNGYTRTAADEHLENITSGKAEDADDDDNDNFQMSMT